MDSNFGNINYFNCKDPASNYKCKYCDFTTDLWITLNHHIWWRHKSFHDYSKIDSKIEIYTCENCKFTSYSILVWRLHERTCTYVSTFSHMMSFYIDRENFFCCKLCEYKSTDGHDFQLHLLNDHTEESGAQCSYNVLSKTNLKNHITDRRKIKWFKCNECMYKAKTKKSLTKHLKTNHKDLYNECKQCSYGTTLKSDLKAHIIERHTYANNIRWFKCDKCEFKTNINRNLNLHIMTKHENLWGFKCSHCSFKTGFKRALRRHVISRHTDPERIKWYECDRCGLKTKRKDSLLRHINIKHAGEGFVH